MIKALPLLQMTLKSQMIMQSLFLVVKKAWVTLIAMSSEVLLTFTHPSREGSLLVLGMSHKSLAWWRPMEVGTRHRHMWRRKGPEVHFSNPWCPGKQTFAATLVTM